MDKNFLDFKKLRIGTLESIYQLNNNIRPEEFFGDVLYVGMGTCYLPKLQTDKVLSTTIIEIDQEIINYNQNTVEKNWNIIHCSADEFETENKYDIIMLDIWYRKTAQAEVFSLVEKYKTFLKPGGEVLYLKSIPK
jgi:16S rRNA A1518/A1519 N6-dimethyltransferase RsmA/KsgA/DIM1 with predicted DNA glycosylase/AP lyase activity